MKENRNLKYFGLFCILVLALIIIGFEYPQAQARAMAKPPPASPPLPSLMIGDIISAESDALKVWRYSFSEPLWTKKTESNYYTQVAIGDVDSDSKSEIAVPVAKAVSKGKVDEFKIFIEVYKEGFATPVSSENYSPGYFTDPSTVICDVMMANVIPESGFQINEIVLQHWYNLVIFKWDGTNFRIVKRIQARYKDLPVVAYNGTTTKNIDTDPEEEIFVSGQDTYSGTGYIYEIDMDQNAGYQIMLISSTKDCSVTNILIGHRLRVAGLDGDVDLEICLPGWVEKKVGDISTWQAYLLILDKNQEGNWQWAYAIIPGYETAKNVHPEIDLDTGELDVTIGEEIALYVNQQPESDYWLYLFSYTSNLSQCQLVRANAINDIKIGIISSENKIVVCGTAPPLKGKNWRKYFEVFSYPGASFWQVFGESGSITDLGIFK